MEKRPLSVCDRRRRRRSIEPLPGVREADTLRRGDDARRQQLVEVSIDCLGEVGLSGATLAQIAGRAGVSPGLIAHYFGDKDGLLEAAFRRLSEKVHAKVREQMMHAHSPRERTLAIVEALLAPSEFSHQSASAWLAFWGAVPHLPALKRVQLAYQKRMLSQLRHALQQRMERERAHQLSTMIAAMIDGIWLRTALSGGQEAHSREARKLLTEFIDGCLAAPSNVH